MKPAKLILTLFFIVIMTSTAQAMTLTMNNSQIQYPETEKLKINLERNLFDWEDVNLEVTINGDAEFTDGAKTKVYSYETLEKNKIIEEKIQLEESTKVQDTIKIDAELTYTAKLVGGFSKKNEVQKTLNIDAIWVETQNCEGTLSLCERQKILLQSTVEELTEENNNLETQILNMSNDKAQLTQELKLTQEERDTLITKGKINKFTLWGFVISTVLLILAIIGIIVYYKRSK